tara:strand:- start:141 stop:620 length:480 start_codon:yes stop_codon:yes gene_type:complete
LAQGNLIENRESKISQLRLRLIEKSVKEFEVGDVWGKITVFSDAESSDYRVLNESQSAEYGQWIEEYIIYQNQLIFLKETSLDWLAEQQNQYQLVESTYYFSDEKSGIKKSKSILINSNRISTEDLEKLSTQTPTLDTLSLSDFNLKQAELQKLLKSPE